MREPPATSKTTLKPGTETLQEESSDCGDATGTTYVSETDLDITEVETVPYTESPPCHRVPEGQRSGPVRDHGDLVNVGPEAQEEKKEEHLQTQADDPLRLVREIFFT